MQTSVCKKDELSLLSLQPLMKLGLMVHLVPSPQICCPVVILATSQSSLCLYKQEAEEEAP